MGEVRARERVRREVCLERGVGVGLEGGLGAGRKGGRGTEIGENEGLFVLFTVSGNTLVCTVS